MCSREPVLVFETPPAVFLALGPKSMALILALRRSSAIIPRTLINAVYHYRQSEHKTEEALNISFDISLPIPVTLVGLTVAMVAVLHIPGFGFEFFDLGLGPKSLSLALALNTKSLITLQWVLPRVQRPHAASVMHERHEARIS